MNCKVIVVKHLLSRVSYNAGETPTPDEGKPPRVGGTSSQSKATSSGASGGKTGKGSKPTKPYKPKGI